MKIFLAVYDQETKKLGTDTTGSKIVQTRPEMLRHLAMGADIIEADGDILWGPSNWALQDAEVVK